MLQHSVIYHAFCSSCEYIVLGKYLFAVGGNDGTSSLDSCERYDPLLNKWKLVASMTHRRWEYVIGHFIIYNFSAGAGVTVLDGYLYAIGGFDDNVCFCWIRNWCHISFYDLYKFNTIVDNWLVFQAPLNSCERYCPDENKWQLLTQMSCPRGRRMSTFQLLIFY